ncbi:MAG: sn-glycerol-3-phosphate ABC transporter permease UgpA [Rhodospirillales bacterium]
MEKRVTLSNLWLPYLLLAPQIAVTLVFFIWPAFQTLIYSTQVQDAFGQRTKFVWFDNFTRLLSDANYYNSAQTTFFFAILVTGIGLALSLLLAVMADRVIRGSSAYKSILIWPYAVAPAVAGALWAFLFNPSVGVIAYALKRLGYDWDFLINGNQAFALIVLAAVWNQISYNFLFFLAGLQSVPKSLIEAAAIDGAGPGRRFWTIIFPLLSPTTFFLMVVNIIAAFFGSFGTVDTITRGGPAKATEILVFKVYNDGFRGQDVGGSAAQSVILMAIVIALTVIQFRYIERKVHY